MDLIDRIKDIASRIPKQVEHIQTEEATKTAFIMPFIAALGYDVFNPLEVIPEFTADIGTKKGEKVDYAIKKDEKIIILIECKWSGANLQKEHMDQMYRYFSVTEARFAILTNGIEYHFYSDIDEQNKMDSKPFFRFNMLHFEDHHINELKKFSKYDFSLDDILTTASTLKYKGAIKRILEDELKNPSEAFVRFFAAQVYEGRLMPQVMEHFTRIVKDARREFINEQIKDRLKSALSENDSDIETPEVVDELEADLESEPKRLGIETTDEEVEAFHIVKAILRESIDVKRIFMRDTKSYCGILLDDNNRKPVCRLHFNHSQKYLGLFSQKTEERVAIDSVDDIFNFAEQLKQTLSDYS